MEQFSLEKYLENPSRKVVTRKGNPVRIVCTDSPILHHPIVGFVECDLFTWTDDGKVIYGGKCEDKNDIFFADEELTEFEKAMQEYYFPELDDFELKRFAKGILDLARKEILKSLPKWKKAPSHEKQTMYGMSEISDIYYKGCFIHLDDIYKALPKEK